MEQEYLQNAEIRRQQEREERIRRTIRVMNETAYGFIGVRCDYFYQGGFVDEQLAVQTPVTVVVPSQAIRNAWYTMLLNHMLSGITIAQQVVGSIARHTPTINPVLQEFVEDEHVNERNRHNRQEQGRIFRYINMGNTRINNQQIRRGNVRGAGRR